MSETYSEDAAIPAMKEAVREQLDEMRVAPIGGALVQTFAQQVDYAKQMSRGMASLPKHLRNNVGDCLAIVDMAIRFGFSPYMVAGKTYIQAERLCFESQLVHAMIERSGILQKRLRFEHSGSIADGTRCVRVTGYLKGEDEPFIYDSLTLSELHPGHVEKESGGVKKRYVLGSQLWDDKPDVQLIYNATYDWARINCPDVLMAMGIPAPDQPPEAEHRYVGPDDRGMIDRGTITALQGTPAAGTEGATAAHIDTELENVAAAAGNGQEAGSVDGDVDPPPAGKRTPAPESEPAGPSKGKTRKAKAKATKEPAEPAAAKEPEPKPAKLPPKPKTIKDWSPYARAHIEAATSSAELAKWWADDMKLRNALGITAEERVPVSNLMNDKCDELKAGGK